MIISPKHKFIFFKPMKTASTAVEHALAAVCGPEALVTGSTSHGDGGGDKDIEARNNMDDDYQLFHSHVSPSIFMDKIKHKEIYKNYKFISMTRNPWEALVSYYWFSLASRKKDLALFEELPNHLREIGVRTGFNNWVDEPALIANISRATKDYYTPAEYLSHCNEGHIDSRVDHYVRFEHLKKDYNFVRFMLGVNSPPLQKFKSGNKLLIKHYSWFYNDKNIKIVEKLFPKTIEKFGYTFDRRVK